MANDLNRWQGIGRLGQDPDIRYMPNGSAVANISIACGSTWKDKESGEKKERVEWVRLVAFGKLAEVIGQYLKKGKQIYADGELRTRKWQDKNGVDRYTTEVVLTNMQMLGSRDDAGDTRASAQADAYGQDKAEAAPAPAKSDFDDDIPF